MDVPSYLLGKKAGGGGGSYTETDPIFSASPAAEITTEDIEKWNNSGASYTAGTNIEITSNNVINNKVPYEQNTSNNVGIFLGLKNNVNDKVPPRNNIILGHTYYMNNLGSNNVLIGTNQGMFMAQKSKCVTIGAGTRSEYDNSIALGCFANTTKSNQCMIGGNTAPINEVDIYTSNGIKTLATTDYLTTIAGYDVTKTQVLKNINGTFTWVDE